MTKLTEPGPAFIPNFLRHALEIPPGYVWQPATRGTMAGWVRPKGAQVDTKHGE